MEIIKKLQIGILTTFLMICCLPMFTQAQHAIYQENCGTPNATTLIENYHGWQDTSVIYTGNGTCDVRTSSASSGYGQASGGGNIMINDTVKWFQISGLNTSGHTDLSLYCGLRKTTAENGQNLVVEISQDNELWTRLELADSLPTGSGTSGWFRVHYLQIPSCENLRIRFSNLANVDYRIDDISIISGEETQLETVAKPTFTPAGSTYYEAKNVTITSSTENATIYYTTDGSIPDNTALLYSAPILVSNTMTIKAIAIRENMYNSEVASASYVIIDTNSLVSLPLDLSTNSAEEHADIEYLPGFRGYHLGTSYADGSIKFEAAQASKATLVAHLDSSPLTLTFELKGKTGGSNPAAYEGIELEISESPDNQHWNSLDVISNEEISIENFSRFSNYSLQPSTRYLRWKLLSASKGNTQLNNIVITKREHEDSTAVQNHIKTIPSIYPNPTKDIIHLVDNEVEISSISIYNLTGQMLKEWSHPSKSISLANCKDGIYILKIHTPEGVISKKVVKY